jgi:SNF2 family DNA or RNA helicase
MQNLLDNQAYAIEKLKKFKVGALFMEAGTGKTRAAYELVKSVSDCDYVLWLTPFRTKQNLRIELDKWAAYDIHIEGIESLSSSDKLMLTLIKKLESSKNPFIIVDESLKIKNWSAKRTQRIIELGRLATYKLILNGTPVSRNLLDVWAQMDFLSPRILNMDIAEYKNTFCEYTKITKRIGNQTKSREFITKYHNIDYLYSLIKHYVFEADLHLSIKQQYIEQTYTIEPQIKEEYDLLKKKYLDDEKLQWIKQNIFLELTQKMQHLYCCAEQKFALIDDVIKAHGIENVIVFTKYIASNEELRRRYEHLIVLSYQKDALGLNLQKYKVTVFFDKIWDYALRLQATRRTFRTGQQHDCIYYDFTGNVGLENLIDKNIEKKCDMLDYFRKHSIQEIKSQL